MTKILDFIAKYLAKTGWSYKIITKENYVEIYEDVYLGDLIMKLQFEYDIKVMTNYERDIYYNINIYREGEMQYNNEPKKILLDVEYVEKVSRKERITLNFYEVDYKNNKVTKIPPAYITDDFIYGAYINTIFLRRMLIIYRNNLPGFITPQILHQIK